MILQDFLTLFIIDLGMKWVVNECNEWVCNECNEWVCNHAPLPT